MSRISSHGEHSELFLAPISTDLCLSKMDSFSHDLCTHPLIQAPNLLAHWFCHLPSSQASSGAEPQTMQIEEESRWVLRILEQGVGLGFLCLEALGLCSVYLLSNLIYLEPFFPSCPISYRVIREILVSRGVSPITLLLEGWLWLLCSRAFIHIRPTIGLTLLHGDTALCSQGHFPLRPLGPETPFLWTSFCQKYYSCIVYTTAALLQAGQH